MPPGGSGKRKRGDRTYSHDNNNDGSRPSPHRPSNLSLAQHNSYQYQNPQQHGFGRDQQDQRNRGGRRGNRNSRGGGPPRSPLDSPNAIPLTARSGISNPSPMSPPTVPTQRPDEPKQPVAPRPNTPVVTASTKTPPIYGYEHLSQEVVDSWQQSGRKSVIATGKQACSREDHIVLGLIFQEVIRSALDGILDPTDAGSVVKEILQPNDRPTISSDEAIPILNDDRSDAGVVFLDCLSIMTESGTDVDSPALQPLVFSTDISPNLIRLQLDTALLNTLGLIRPTFSRMGIRVTTNVLYRQANFNLLREETEGYSKLITELFTTGNDEPPTAEAVEDAFVRVKGMIGTFDMDVGRVLDVTLDVFAAVLVKQYRFFVKLLRISSWWPQQDTLGDGSKGFTSGGLPRWALPGVSGIPSSSAQDKEEVAQHRSARDTLFWERVRAIGMNAFFEIGGRSAVNAASFASKSAVNDSNQLQSDEAHHWVETTGTLPPASNPVAAQILGFKLRFYSSSARDADDVLPVNLIYLAALLIKIGFISLRDLYPHLYPGDEHMEAVKETKMKEKAERERLNRPGGGTMNALMSAGALADDTLPGGRLREIDGNRGTPSKADTADEKATTGPNVDGKELPEPADQKVQLLKSLLCIGAIPESLYILGRFPWLPEAFPEIPEYIHRILNYSLSKVYERLQPLRDHTDVKEPQKLVDLDQSGAQKGFVRQFDQPPRKSLRWAELDKDDANEGRDYRFYWEDWADNIPVCQNVDDVFSLCGTLLNLTGVKIGQDPTLLLKLARIGSDSLTTDSSDLNKKRWVDLSKRLIVPALSLVKRNPPVVNEVFELLKHFPVATRYTIYAEWYTGPTSRSPDIKSAFDQVRAETKDILKRISKTNIKPMARALAKVAYASPGIVFSVAIGQIETYDNLVDVVVECARYFTYLGYDVLTWSLLSALGGPGRNRVQADGMLTSKWLTALSFFAGKVFKRYSVMSPTPILQYVNAQLRRGNSTDLKVLAELTSSMAGIVSDTNFNEAQVAAMAGGPRMQALVLLQLHDRRHESKQTAKRLIKSLVETKLVGQLLISISQERKTCIFKLPEEDSHLKLLGNLFDEIHRYLTQYLDLLRHHLSVKDFDGLVPGVAQLISVFGVEPAIAFWICRPSIAAAMVDYDARVAIENAAKKKNSIAPEVLNIESEKDVEMTEGEIAEVEQSLVDDAEMDNRPSGEVTDINDDVEMKDDPKLDPQLPVETPSNDTNDLVDSCHPILQEMLSAIQPTVPEETWEILSGPFYVTFWQLSLHDLLVPTPSYDTQSLEYKRLITTIKSDRSDISVAGTQRKEEKVKAISETQANLSAEIKNHMNKYIVTRSRLQKEKDKWFGSAWGKWDALNIALIEHCFLPRILVSSSDAVYTYKMLRLLHAVGAPNFRTMGVLDQFFNEKRLISMIFLSTAKEVENLGRFLNEVLKELAKWHSDKLVFEKEAYGGRKNLPGFSKKMANARTVSTFWTYEDFRRILLKWHRNLNAALKTCLTGGEYMHIRNAIIILKTIHLYFPAVNWMGQSQVASIEELGRSESREDLKIAAMSLLGNLKRREKEWMIPQAFNLNEGSTNSPNGARSSSTKPSTPQTDRDINAALNAKAPEFKPSTQANGNGIAKPSHTAHGRLEVEDGEIDDANLAKSITKSTHPLVPAENTLADPKLSIPRVRKPEVANEHSNGTQSAADLIARGLLHTSHSGTSKPLPQSEDVLRSASDGSAGYSSTISRLDLSRNPSDNLTPGARPQHALPNRPEPLIPRSNDYRSHERHNDRGPRDSRDSRYPETLRPERSGEHPRAEHHTSGSYQRAHERPLDRPLFDERDRIEPPWGGEKDHLARPPFNERHGGPHSRDIRPVSKEVRLDRSLRDRPYPETLEDARHPDSQGRSSRDSSMAPPRPTLPPHPDRAAQIYAPEEQDRTNLTIHADRRSESSRYEGYTNSHRGSRTTSPSRRDDIRQPRRNDHRTEDPSRLDNRNSTEDTGHVHSSRSDDTRPPTGPRTGRDRTTDGPLPSPGDRFRDTLRGPPPGNAPPIDLSHGRLSQDFNPSHRQQDSHGDRHKSGSDSHDIPSGPRLTNSSYPPAARGGRNVSAPQPHINTQQPLPQPSLPSPTVVGRGAPTGPSSNRLNPRESVQLPRSSIAPSSAPQTPVTETPDVAGIHPDRLKAFQEPGTTVTSNAVPSSSNFQGNTQPPPSPLSVNPPAAPRGLNGIQPPSPRGPPRHGPPTGPASGNDRNRSDKRFAGIQNMLQQSNTPMHDRSNQGTSIRGRGGRTNQTLGHNVTSPVTAGPLTPSNVRQDPYPPTRADLFVGRSSGPGTPQHGEEDLSNNGRDTRRDRPGRDESDRRAPRPRSRSPTRHHHVDSNNENLPPSHMPPSMRPQDDPRPYRQRDDYRRGGRGGNMPLNDRGGRRSGRDEEFNNHERRPDSDRRDVDEHRDRDRGWERPPPGSALDLRGGGGGNGRDDKDRESDRRDGAGGGGSMVRKRGRGVMDEGMGPGPIYGGDGGGNGGGKRPRRNG